MARSATWEGTTRPRREPALFYKIIALFHQGKEAEAEAHLCEGLKRREDLSHKGAMLASLLANPPMEP